MRAHAHERTEHHADQHGTGHDGPEPYANEDAAELLLARLVEPSNYRVYTKQTSLNLRSRPQHGDNVVGELPRGAVVQGGAVRHGFVAVSAHGKTGWASSRYLRKGDACERPAPTQADAHELLHPEPVHVDEPQSDEPLIERKGEPFIKEEGDQTDIEAKDVIQGSVGDCWLLAAAAAVATTNPEAIRRLIRDNKDGTYDVTLYVADHAWKKKTAHVIRVDAKFPLDAAAHPHDSNKDGVELWPMLIEKAYAQYQGRYVGRLGGLIGGIDGGAESSGLELLLPASSSVHFTIGSSPHETLSRISLALAEHRPVTASTTPILLPESNWHAGELGLYGGHEYSVVSTTPAASTLCLNNPWGQKHLTELSMDDFDRYFLSYSIGPRL